MTDKPGHPIDLPGAPPITGLRFRAYGGEQDIPSLAEVVNAANAADGETERWGVGMLRAELRSPTHLAPEERMVLAWVGDRLVAYGEIEYADTADGERHYSSLGHVHPDWRRRGLGSAMMAYSEGQLLDLAARDAYPGVRKLTTWFNDPDTGGIELAKQRGYERVRIYHHMTRPHMEHIAAPTLPDGIVVRPVTRDLLPRVWSAMAEAFLDHFGAQDFSDAAYQRWIDDPLLEPGLLVVAFDGDEVVAGVQGMIDPEENEVNGYLRGWTDPVFTRRAWRRRGLAFGLLGRSLLQLRERGMTSAQLGVDAQSENQAMTLYERHHYRIDRSASEWHMPLDREP